ncbi:PepSY-associated TM helix domain-containing protein [Mitsuaria sp. WAJ17]|uniref:PepSY-associated TM helix domain-containing protein n=1 Tax=Mitsuaria sp. WAJ17 TaxID=2761452 RepID=UPI00160391F8|nr:PepSY-associated TM helix domain-containing protein [Mitsuaria sp. WAJ17]MBB2486794.1 PepSY-associated TM helix domain-containing protein [Mitsuaria sp. WAJ17]
MTDVARPGGKPSRAGWMRTLYQWHWISSALSLVGMLLFAVTGFTLNHAADIESKPRVVQRELSLPAALLPALAPSSLQGDAAVPAPVRDWLVRELDAELARDGSVEWSPEELYMALPRPGGDAWLRLDRQSGVLEYENSDRGWLAYINDLHKGRHAGRAWSLFIDVFAGACLLFCLTGLLILQQHAGRRPGTWPLVGAGLVLPVLLALLLVH